MGAGAPCTLQALGAYRFSPNDFNSPAYIEPLCSDGWAAVASVHLPVRHDRAKLALNKRKRMEARRLLCGRGRMTGLQHQQISGQRALRILLAPGASPRPLPCPVGEETHSRSKPTLLVQFMRGSSSFTRAKQRPSSPAHTLLVNRLQALRPVWSLGLRCPAARTGCAA